MEKKIFRAVAITFALLMTGGVFYLFRLSDERAKAGAKAFEEENRLKAKKIKELEAHIQELDQALQLSRGGKDPSH